MFIVLLYPEDGEKIEYTRGTDGKWYYRLTKIADNREMDAGLYGDSSWNDRVLERVKDAINNLSDLHTKYVQESSLLQWGDRWQWIWEYTPLDGYDCLFLAGLPNDGSQRIHYVRVDNPPNGLFKPTTVQIGETKKRKLIRS